jgi:nicotinamide-nucleotide amidase
MQKEGLSDMTAEIISIGTELLLGQIVDTDAAHLSQELATLGIVIYHRSNVGDNKERCVAAIKQALARADAVFCVGGLGPTMDDLTRDAIAEAFGVSLVRDSAIVAHLNQWFESRNYTMLDSVLRQADVPEGGIPLPNPNGTAPGLWVENTNKIIVALPGPPNEFIPMVENELLPRLRQKLGATQQVIQSRTLRVVGVGESLVEEQLKPLMQATSPTVAPYAKMAEVHLRITAKAASTEEADKIIAPVADKIHEILGENIYAEGDALLEEVVVGLLNQQKKTVATAESCTGGTLAGRITNVSGSSSVFATGLVTYSNEAKVHLLHVPQALVAAKGAVSPEVAQAMAERVRELAEADFGISITGIAGPTGGTSDKPVGLVYIALAGPNGTEVHKNLYSGKRADIRFRSTQTALDMLRRTLLL